MVYRKRICHFLPPIFRKLSSQNFKIHSKLTPSHRPLQFAGHCSSQHTSSGHFPNLPLSTVQNSPHLQRPLQFAGRCSSPPTSSGHFPNRPLSTVQRTGRRPPRRQAHPTDNVSQLSLSDLFMDFFFLGMGW
jgi:hypothetical protein